MGSTALTHKCQLELIHVNYFIGILIPCLAAFEAVFHLQVSQGLPFSSSRYFIEHSVPVLFAHIFPN